MNRSIEKAALQQVQLPEAIHKPHIGYRETDELFAHVYKLPYKKKREIIFFFFFFLSVTFLKSIRKKISLRDSDFFFFKILFLYFESPTNGSY